MSQGGLPPNVRDFVVRHITSVEQMELLLLFASDPSRGWTVPQLVTELRSSERSVSQRLGQLIKEGFLTRSEGNFQRASLPAETMAAVQDLAVVYREYRVRVIELIYSQPRGLKSFSDAFKFKPED